MYWRMPSRPPAGGLAVASLQSLQNGAEAFDDFTAQVWDTHAGVAHLAQPVHNAVHQVEQDVVFGGNEDLAVKLDVGVAVILPILAGDVPFDGFFPVAYGKL
jgi:hypothetical protein